MNKIIQTELDMSVRNKPSVVAVKNRKNRKIGIRLAAKRAKIVSLYF